MRRSAPAALAFLAALAASAPTANAQNLVNNPGFEAGRANWTFSGGFTNVTTDPTQAYSGTASAQFGAVGSQGSATQTIATTPGAAYTFSFWLRNDGDPVNWFVANFGSTTLLSLVDQSPFAYEQYSYDVVATDAQTAVTFTGRQDPAYYRVDDVSVTPATVTPEPATFALLGAGLAAVALAARRRRAATA